jgi:hypothetical protein
MLNHESYLQSPRRCAFSIHLLTKPKVILRAPDFTQLS